MAMREARMRVLSLRFQEIEKGYWARFEEANLKRIAAEHAQREQEEQAALLQARMEQEQAFARMAELGPDDQESLGRRLPQSGNPLVVCCLSPDRGSPPVLCAPQRWPFGCSRRKTSSSCAARSGAASARRTWGGSYDRFF